MNKTLSALLFTSTLLLSSLAYPYQSESEVKGQIVSVGSDTLLDLMKLWAEAFKEYHPDSSIQITAEGSSTAPPALTSGQSQLAPMSRKMKSSEVEKFQLAHGYKPTPIKVALDALAIFVHKENKVPGMSLAQVDSVFSSTAKCTGGSAVSSWSDVPGASASGDIVLYGRNNQSGTHGFFKKKALCKGDFKGNTNELVHSEDIISKISKDKNAVGYSGIGYLTDDVRAIPLSKKEGQALVEPTAENASIGKYPLSRYLYVYVNKHPENGIDPAVKEFLSFVLSRHGQAIVQDQGYISLPSKVVQKEEKNL